MSVYLRLLEALDFNSLNSGDEVAKVYFRHSADAIRMLEAALERSRAQVSQQREIAIAAKQRALAAESALAVAEARAGSGVEG